MSKNVIGVCGILVFLCGIFLPFMGLEQNQSDVLPILLSGVCMIVALGLMIQAIKPHLLKYYAVGVSTLVACVGALLVAGFFLQA